MDEQTKPHLTIQTVAAQANAAAELVTGAIVAPIHMSATFLRDADNGYRSGYVYGRSDNASVQQAENLIAALEGAEEAMVFSSGMAAATSVFLALDKPTHIIASRIMYWGFRSWLREIGRYGHSVSFVETSDLDAVRKAVRPGETGLFWIETPSNPLWTITDIAAIAEIAHAADAVLCIDSTVATPILTRPLAFGADIVMHSATKYLNGHSDVIAGALAAAREGPFWARIRKTRRPARQRAERLRRLAADAGLAHARCSRAWRSRRRRRRSRRAWSGIRHCRRSCIPACRSMPGTKSRSGR